MEHRTVAVLNGSRVVAFGKLFVKKGRNIPALPDMKLLVLKTQDGFQAICVDLEIDSVGETLNEACNNLIKALSIYTQVSIDKFGNIQDAVKDIVNVAYSAGGKQKEELFNLYLQAKRAFIMKKVEEKKKVNSRVEKLGEAISSLFQWEPIRYTLQTA
jgi:hypothetical protein